MNTTLAPIALFTYSRLWHTQQTVQALQKNIFASQSDLYIFSDAPLDSSSDENVKKVRAYIKTIDGFKNIIIVKREKNLGLARSVITGVTEVVSRYGRIIVLEDDMVTSPYFLKYMNEALDLYKDEERVISIHGFVYPILRQLPETFFLKGADCWGWATWKRGWDLFEADGRKLLSEIHKRKLNKRFDINGSYPYTKMLKAQIKGINDSWAIRWYASAFLLDRLTLYPGKSLIRNIGTDESGTHCGETTAYDTEIVYEQVNIIKNPIEENVFALREFEKFFRSTSKSFRNKVINYLKHLKVIR